MALRQGVRSSVAKAKSAPAPAPASAPALPSRWVLSTQGTTTLRSNTAGPHEHERERGDNETNTLNNGEVYDISNLEPLIESRERFWTNLFKFSSEVFDHSLPGPSVYEVYRSLRTARPLEECIGLKPPTASDYCDVDPDEDSPDDYCHDSHDEDSYSESEDYGVFVPEDLRGNRKLLRSLRVRHRLRQSIRRRKDRQVRKALMRKT